MAKRMTLDDFSIREQAEEGVKVYLMNPKTGETTEEWLRILSTDSKAFRQAQARHNTKRMEFLRDKSKRDDPDKALDFETESERALLAALVVEWSLVGEDEKPTPCDREQVEKLFYRAPQIQEQVAQFADNRRNFSKPPLAS